MLRTFEHFAVLFLHFFFLFPTFIAVGVLRDMKTIEDILARRPKLKEEMWIMGWEENVLDSPVFPEIMLHGPSEKPKKQIFTEGIKHQVEHNERDAYSAWTYTLREKGRSSKSMVTI